MDNVYRTRRHKPVRKRVFFALLVAFLLIFGVLLYKGAGVAIVFINNLIARIQLSHVKPINILLLGVGGGTHDGPDLTDTIIFVHIDPVNKKVTLVSLPRDLWIPSLGAKVNATYTVASEKQPGSGLSYTESAIGTILGQKINYGVKLDFG